MITAQDLKNIEERIRTVMDSFNDEERKIAYFYLNRLGITLFEAEKFVTAMLDDVKS